MEEKDSPSEKTDTKIEFKKPVLVGRIGKLPKKAKCDVEKVLEVKPVEKPTEELQPAPSPKSSLPPAVLLKELSTPIPYKEPKWSGLCPDGSEYGLEVIKSGMIVEKLEMTKKPYYVFGRLANCDVVLAHPTLSRHHAVLQYKAFADDTGPPPGWYMYDLGSTHGTFLNKERLKPHHYTRVRVGHQIKFGNSSRTYIMLGPDFDCEGESELSVTEIKRRAETMKQERDRMIQEAIEQREKDRLEEEKKREEQGIDWGMGEDAEDEPELADNPFASTANEELYLSDPKKTLRGYFEREGHELVYDCEERGTGQFLCRVELPLDDARGRPLVAEALLKGKKKEAVAACALEACRMLDRAGLLRQAKHESRRRKQRDWAADDYYSSDEDSFLDRTGAVERKRTARMGRGTRSDQPPLTYQELLKQITEIEAKITSEEKLLERLRSTDKVPTKSSEEQDALDEYMSSLKGPSMATKAEISKTKMSIQKLKSELSKTHRLASLARPAHVPALLKRGESSAPVKLAANSAVYGKRIKLKEDITKKPQKKTEIKKVDEEFVEEMDSDEEVEQNKTEATVNHSIVKEYENSKNDVKNVTDNVNNDIKNVKTDTKYVESDKNTKSKQEKKVYGPMRPPDDYVVPEGYFDQESDRDKPEIMEADNI